MLLKNDGDPAAGLRRRPNGRRGRPARRHALHRLVQRHAAVRGDPGATACASGSATAPRSGSARASTGSRCARSAPASTSPADRPGAVPFSARRRARRPRDAQFDVFDWGEGVVTLRSAANGRYVGDNWGPFRNDQARPNGWFVQQQFKLEEQPDGTYVVRYAGYEKAYDWSGAEPLPDGRRRRHARARRGHRRPGGALREGGGPRRRSPRPQQAAAGADAAVVVVGSMPFINGREDQDRPDLALAHGQDALVEAVAAANPRTVAGAREQLPDHDRLGAASTCRRSCGPRTAGRRPATRSPTCCSATATRPGGSPRPGTAPTTDLPDILDYDIIRNGTTYLYYRGDPLYPSGTGCPTPRSSTPGSGCRSTDADGRVRDRLGRRHQHRRPGRRRGGAALHAPAQPRGSSSRCGRCAASSGCTLEPGETRTVRFVLATGRPGALGRDTRPLGRGDQPPRT